MTDHPLRPVTHRRLGRPLPCQLANGTWANPRTVALTAPPLLLRDYAVLAFVSKRYSPFEGMFPCITHPCATLLIPKDFRVRLACIRHAASVHSEPGSNSKVQILDGSKPVFFICLHSTNHRSGRSRIDVRTYSVFYSVFKELCRAVCFFVSFYATRRKGIRPRTINVKHFFP